MAELQLSRSVCSCCSYLIRLSIHLLLLLLLIYVALAAVFGVSVVAFDTVVVAAVFVAIDTGVAAVVAVVFDVAAVSAIWTPRYPFYF